MDEQSVEQLKKHLATVHPDLSPEDINKIAASLLELAAFLVKMSISHKNQQKKE